MRIVGIDYGAKRVGVAVSDESGKIALPFSVVRNTPDLAAEIAAIAEENGAKDIIIGESRDYSGAPNPIFEAADKFKNDMEKRGFKVFLELEFMTSIQAERIQGKNEMSDASAAALILQSYLDRSADNR